MSVTQHAPAAERRSAALAAWIVPLTRAAIAVVLGLVVTFSPDHSAAFGQLAFGAFAILTGAVQLAGGLVSRRARRPWSLAALQGVIAIAAGIASLVVPADGGLLVAIVSAWAILTGAVEIVTGVTARPEAGAHELTRRDSLTSGVLAVLLGAIVLVVPPDYRQPWRIADGDVVEASGEVTASIMVVGILGAWAIIHGVLLAIAAISARRPAPASPEVTP